jgi:P-type E1-E2 ATPase
MIELNIPGTGIIQLKHLVSDVSGSLAIDGMLIDGLARLFNDLQDRLEIHMLTADTHGRQEIIDQQLNLEAVRIQAGREGQQKADYVNQLSAENVLAIGQGANDAAMLKSAAIGICVLSREGAAVETLMAADLVVPDIFTALELLQNPIRMVASLRK